MELNPSEKCKYAGLKSLDELAQITGRPVRTLTEWGRTDPEWFDLVLVGAVVRKRAQMLEEARVKLVESHSSGAPGGDRSKEPK